MDHEEFGEIEGYVDTASLVEVRGWCWLPQLPAISLLVELRVNGEVVAQKVACQYRDDLFEAGKRFGACSFTFREFDTIVDIDDVDIQVSVIRPLLHRLPKL